MGVLFASHLLYPVYSASLKLFSPQISQISECRIEGLNVSYEFRLRHNYLAWPCFLTSRVPLGTKQCICLNFNSLFQDLGSMEAVHFKCRWAFQYLVRRSIRRICLCCNSCVSQRYCPLIHITQYIPLRLEFFNFHKIDECFAYFLIVFHENYV